MLLSLWHYWWCLTIFTLFPSPKGLIWQRHLMWDVRNMWAPQMKKTAVLFPLFYTLSSIQTSPMLLFSVRFFLYLDFCLKLPLLKGRANTLISKLSCYYSGGVLSLGFSRDHSSLLGLSTELYSTLFESRLAEGVPFLSCRDTYGVETEVCFLFPPHPLNHGACWVPRKAEIRDSFALQLLLESFSCIGGCGTARWWCPAWWHSIPEKNKPEFQSLL